MRVLHVMGRLLHRLLNLLFHTLFSEDKTKICKQERTLRPAVFTSSPTLTKDSQSTPGVNKWPYHLPENSGVSATVYQMDGTHDEDSVRGSKNSSELFRIYSSLRIQLTVLLLHIIFLFLT